MGAILEQNPFGSKYAAVDGLGNERRGFIVATGNHQGGQHNFAQPVDNIPVFEQTDHVELTGTVHGIVYFGIFGEFFK